MVRAESGISITGIDSLKEKVQRTLIGALQEAALNIETGAKQDCPVHFGILRNSIHIEPITGEEDVYGYKIGSYLPYAPYVEFGTGTRVSVPAQYEDFALLFKGKKEVVGMNAQPYLLPNFEMQVEQFKSNIEKALSNV